MTPSHRNRFSFPFRTLRRAACQAVLLLAMTTPLPAQQPAPDASEPKAPETRGDPVIAWGQEVFRVEIGADDVGITVAERARLIVERIESIDPATFDPARLTVASTGPRGTTIDSIYYGEQLIVRITPEDLRAAGLAPRDPEAHAQYVERIRAAIADAVQVRIAQLATPPVEKVNIATLADLAQAYLSDPDLRQWARGIGLSLLQAVLLIVVIWLLARIFNFVFDRLENLKGGFNRPLRLRGRILMSAATVRTIFVGALRIAHLGITLAVVLLFSNSILGLFPDYAGWPLKEYVRGIIYVILITILALGVFRLANQFFDFLRARIRFLRARGKQGLSFQRVSLLTVGQLASVADTIARTLRFIIYLLFVYLYLTASFSVFQFTRRWSAALLEYVSDPVHTMVAGIVAYLPNIFFIVVIGFATYYLLRVLRLLFVETARGRITISGFYPDWALPTYRLVSFILIAFALVMAFPYLPGSDSDAFRGISILLGFMVSLGSSTLIGNIMAGIVVTYMRPFTIGDRVKIADTEGDVIEKTLLVTRIRTIKNVDITIPNGLVLASHIINYSSSVGDGQGLVLNTSVTIGYDVPWRQVHELLLSAAGAVQGIRTNPAPFVLQTSLDDYYVSYQLNAYTNQPGRMAQIYSALHGEIQDRFFAAGVEILSPHYYALREGNQAAMPADQLPTDYKAPRFRIDARAKPDKS